MKKMIKIGSLLLLMMSVTVVAQAQKFGYVNTASILAQMPEVKQADANLEALQKQLQKKGQDMLTKLQNDYVAIQQQVERGELSPKQQETEAQNLEKRQQEIASFEQDMVKQIQDKRTELLQPIYDKINNAISEVASENGYTMIFDANVLLYSEDSQDVSEMVKSKLGILN